MAHPDGMIGFPLRLLARENYEKLVAAKVVEHVALLTGEEKIIPRQAHWFSCTVEAMPRERKMSFVAIDEIQLCADPEREHVFTDRLLHCRGTMETLLLDADTMRPILKSLFPGIKIEMRLRLSSLSHIGHLSLTKLPPRSAIVAFSVPEVYAIADILRRRRGGCAIVMGQLSPQTRNAQVALFQNREVDYLVATDAIGMGLNMDVEHVALAARHKFDGAHFRALSPHELAHIFGRAGRGLKDGTFGTTESAPPLAPDLVQQIENHHFAPLKHIVWRNDALDFTAVTTLKQSLSRPSSHDAVRRGREASDVITLHALARSPSVQSWATTHVQVQRL
ncbi:MAG: helicase-related protein [Acetobacteraceae bacterium]